MKKICAIICLVFGAYLLAMAGISFGSANTLYVDTKYTSSGGYTYVRPAFSDIGHMSIDELVSFGVGCSTSRLCYNELEALNNKYVQTQFFMKWAIINGLLSVVFILPGILLLVLPTRRR